MYINWDLALQKDSTVVFYMGLSNLQEITSELIARGCPEDKPFAVVAQGTAETQQVLVGTVSDIAEKLSRHPLPSPALLMMGDVINANGYAQHLADLTTAARPFSTERLERYLSLNPNRCGALHRLNFTSAYGRLLLCKKVQRE